MMETVMTTTTTTSSQPPQQPATASVSASVSVSASASASASASGGGDISSGGDDSSDNIVVPISLSVLSQKPEFPSSSSCFKNPWGGGGTGSGSGSGGRSIKRMKISSKYNYNNTSSSSLGNIGFNNTNTTNTNTTSMNDIELAKLMYELSVQERENIYDDIHGVFQPPNETIDFTQEKIQQFDLCVTKTSIKKKKAYSRALFLYPKLQTDTELKLSFLRAEQFDTKLAAQRMINYYEEKRKLFSESKLVKTLTLDDLSDADKTFFHIGGSQTMLPIIKDSSGRTICLFDGANFDFDEFKHGMDINNFVRGFWYVIEVAGSTKEAQQKGIVTIMYPSGYNFLSNNIKTTLGISRFIELMMKTGYLISKCLPIRFSSFHLCYNDPQLKPYVNTIRMAVGKSTMLRLRTHFGSNVEMEYDLMTFGIPSSGLLCCNNNSSDHKSQTQLYDDYIKRREEIERKQQQQQQQELNQSSSQPPEYVPFPSCNDVLIGRGRPYRDYIGNITWNKIIDDNMDQYYNKCKTRFDKTCVTMDVIKLIRSKKYSSEIRYILERTPNNNGWKVLDDINAREKVAVAFQNRGRHLNKAKINKLK